jgi:PAS domain S-box-containing protein
MAAALEAQVARAESVIESAPDPIVIVDREGRIAIVNARTEAAFGYARAQLLGQPVEMLIPQWLHAAHVAQGAPNQEDPHLRAMGAGREWLARRQDGNEFVVEVSLSPLVTPEGTFIISTVRDVTERKQAEQRIHAQLEHLKLLDQITRATSERLDLKSVLQIVLIRLENSLPVDFGCVGLYDAPANTLRVASVGVRSETLAHELALEEQTTIEIDQNGLSRCVQGQLVYEPDIGQLPFPFPARLARGGLGSMVLAPLKSESRVFGVLVVARREANAFSSTECEFLRQLSEHVGLAAHQADLYSSLQQAYDDLRQTQAAAMQEERLRALGQMASGIAHDINNALSPVSLYVEAMLESERNLSERARDYLETIQRAVEDVAQTVARMREFYRQREGQLVLAPVEVNDLVQQVLDLTHARWSDMPLQHGVVVEAVTQLAPELPKIMGVESEIREALTNLVFNAVDAMPRGGVLTLRTRLAQSDTAHPAVTVEVVDTGGGMDEDTRRRCVEPFFTTKGERGTGLGLAMVFGMAQRHNAALEIDSAPGAGTTARLVFAVPAVVQAEPRLPAGAADVPPRLRLLLVDDDPTLLKSLRDTLETDGHFIVAASGGEAGIAAFRAALGGADPFAAVITDLGMPYVDGRRVAAAVKEASPATPVIMLTGWGRRLVAEGDIPPHVDRVLAKPPRLREVREALASLCPMQQAD